MRPRLIMVASAIAAASLLAVHAGSGAAKDLPIETRYGGRDRYQTAALVSAATFTQAPVAFIANGGDFADAIAAAPAATVEQGPVLLVAAASIPPATIAELTRLKPARIAVVGGPGAVNDSVLRMLHRYTPGPVVRLAGHDRDATSAAVSTSAFQPGVRAVYIASDRNYADALVAGAAAAEAGDPVLLVGRDGVPAALARELTRLRPSSIVIVGGIFAVTEKTAHLLSAYTKGAVTREMGTDRYDTSVALARVSFATATTVYLASGDSFPDALAGAVAAGVAHAPLLLVSASCVPRPVQSEIAGLGATSIFLLGGRTAIPQRVASLIPC
jgi:putative cell wall-binding protein